MPDFRRVRACSMTAERRSEIDQIVAQKAASAFGHIHVKRVADAYVVVIEPGAKESQSTEISPPLMRNDVVCGRRT